jgi:opacity protein-like surface antigen
MKTAAWIIPVLFCLLEEPKSQSTSLGIKGGLNFGHFTGEDSDIDGTEREMRLGFQAGAFLDLVLNPLFSLQPEVQFSQKGETFKAGDATISGTWKVQMDYIEVPVLAKIYVPTGPRTQPYVYAGPYIGWNINAETDEIYELGAFDLETGSDLEEDAQPWESGVALGAGLSQDLRNTRVFLDLRYTLGLTKAFDNGTYDDVFTGVLAVQLGIGAKL